MNIHDKTEPDLIFEAEAEAAAKRREVIRELMRVVVACITSSLLAKGMMLAAHADEIAWMAAFGFSAGFWLLIMWEK